MIGDNAGSITRLVVAVVVTLAVVSVPVGLQAQTIRGQLVDAENGAPVGLAGIFILSAARDVLVRAASDMAGFYSVEVPDAGEYYLFVQRIGYFENETPLFRAEADRTYSVDVEMRPEPFRIDALSVTVENEELETFLTLRLGENPNGLFGYRAYQGSMLQEAKLGAEDNTETLRRLNVWVSHGRQVCINAVASGGASLPSRNGLARSTTPDQGEAIGDRGRVIPAVEESGQGGRGCGSLYLDGYPVPNDQIEQLEMESVAVVVTLPGTVRQWGWPGSSFWVQIGIYWSVRLPTWMASIQSRLRPLARSTCMYNASATSRTRRLSSGLRRIERTPWMSRCALNPSGSMH